MRNVQGSSGKLKKSRDRCQHFFFIKQKDKGIKINIPQKHHLSRSIQKREKKILTQQISTERERKVAYFADRYGMVGLGTAPQSERSLVQLLVMAGPPLGYMREATDQCFSPLFILPLPLSINK